MRFLGKLHQLCFQKGQPILHKSLTYECDFLAVRKPFFFNRFWLSISNGKGEHFENLANSGIDVLNNSPVNGSLKICEVLTFSCESCVKICATKGTESNISREYENKFFPFLSQSKNALKVCNQKRTKPRRKGKCDFSAFWRLQLVAGKKTLGPWSQLIRECGWQMTWCLCG